MTVKRTTTIIEHVEVDGFDVQALSRDSGVDPANAFFGMISLDANSSLAVARRGGGTVFIREQHTDVAILPDPAKESYLLKGSEPAE